MDSVLLALMEKVSGPHFHTKTSQKKSEMFISLSQVKYNITTTIAFNKLPV